MKLNNLNNITFGKYLGYRKSDKLLLTSEERITMILLGDEIKKCSDELDVTAHVCTPRRINGKTAVRVEVKPSKALYEKISVMAPPNTTFDDYTKVSTWIPLNNFDVIEKITAFINDKKLTYDRYSQTPNHYIKQTFYRDEFYQKYID